MDLMESMETRCTPSPLGGDPGQTTEELTGQQSLIAVLMDVPLD